MFPFELVEPRSLSRETLTCAEALAADSPEEYRQLAALLVARWRSIGRNQIGLAGGQGSGKSTLCALIHEAGAYFGEHIEILGIDDFYLTKSEREVLGKNVHPLCSTRGPPGTHDVNELERTIGSLVAGELTRVPVFDKGQDDRDGYRDVDLRPDRIVLEGWCVGARAQSESELQTPINELEENQDDSGTWRHFVNQQLTANYARVFEAFDELVYLQVPNLDAVRKWRLQQEGDREPELRMTKQAVNEFVQHYERITLAMLNELPSKCDVLVELDDEHRVANLSFS